MRDFGGNFNLHPALVESTLKDSKTCGSLDLDFSFDLGLLPPNSNPEFSVSAESEPGSDESVNIQRIPSIVWHKCNKPECGRKFSSFEGLEYVYPSHLKDSYSLGDRKHKLERHPKKSLHCGSPGCPSFSDHRSLQRHLKSLRHSGEESQMCKCPCGYRNARWDKFREHTSKCHTKGTKSTCWTCACRNSFENLENLILHYDTTHKGKRGRPPGPRRGRRP
jgi:hypothetical protein